MNYTEFKDKAIASILKKRMDEIDHYYKRFSKLEMLCEGINGMNAIVHISKFYDGYPSIEVRIAKDSAFNESEYAKQFAAIRMAIKKEGCWFPEFRGTTWQKVLMNAPELAPLKLHKEILGEQWEDNEDYISIPISKITAV